jgi:DNA replication protein DnaC
MSDDDLPVTGLKQRHDREQTLGEAVAELLSNVKLPERSEAEWAKLEQRAARDRQAPIASYLASRPARAEQLADLDWPERSIESAVRADEKREAIAKLGAWNVMDKNVVVLSGQPGCGKTVAAAWWSLRRPERVRFMRATTFAAASRYDQAARAAWARADALVLDDLGAEYLDGQGSFRVDLDELIDTYYSDRRPLILTTNLNSQLFRKNYGERVWDRLRECARWVPVSEQSLRGGKNQ